MILSGTPGDLKNFEEVVTYIRSCLNECDQRPDEEVVASIVSLGANDLFEEWYRNKNFVLISDDSSDLEWSNGNPQELQFLWQQIDSALEVLTRETSEV